jgi:DNA-directed RNA polymerase specialized sigma24 family protein
MTFSEIAEALGRREGTVRSNMALALASLRQTVAPDLSE